MSVGHQPGSYSDKKILLVQDREMIYESVVGRPYNGLDPSIDVRISRLRKKLHDSLDSPFRIKTIWGQGYLLVPDAWV